MNLLFKNYATREKFSIALTGEQISAILYLEQRKMHQQVGIAEQSLLRKGLIELFQKGNFKLPFVRLTSAGQNLCALVKEAGFCAVDVEPIILDSEAA